MNLLKKIILLPLVFSLAATPYTVFADHEPGHKEPPELSTNAETAALVDVNSGRVLYSKDGDKEMRIASLTKIMTAIVAIEQGDLKSTVTVGKNAAGKEGSSIYLKQGEKMTLENMLFGLMLRSGNDAATAIAEHIGGSEEGFVHLMNVKAEEIGLKHTQFKNPHGLDAEGHYSTAEDMAKLTAYALHNADFKRIVATEERKAPNPEESWDYDWHNKNKMLRLYEGADGVKTGYTKKAFRCLVSSATRNGQQLVAVTLNDGDDWNDHANMLDFGFEHYHLKELAKKGQSIQKFQYITGNNFKYPLLAAEVSDVKTKLILYNQQLDKGKRSKVDESSSFGLMGRVEFLLGETKIGEIPVYEKGSLIPKDKAAEAMALDFGHLKGDSLLGSLKQVFDQLFDMR
ncbi:D-alanyl-D-alanine carboxypeptidase [Neobacillus mesonae]|nr:D-alanyl-D-alanine carboxypeptidase [Neobacillus mesonae]